MERPDETQRNSARFIMAVVACVVFAWFSHTRLYHSDLWAHLSYGRLICQTQSLPQTEPFIPLAAGVPLKTTAWLSQVGGFQIWSACGLHGLQVLYALVIAASAALVCGAAFNKTGNRFWSVCAALLFLRVARIQLLIIRPQLAGIFCFCAVLWLVHSKLTRRQYIALAVLFVCWANLHPSFPAGLILLAGYTAGHLLDVWRRTGRFSRALAHQQTQRLIAASALAAVAVLINPYGLDLYFEVLRVSGNPNLRVLLDWQPLSLKSSQGTIAVATMVLVAIVLWRSPRRLRGGELLALLVAAIGTVYSSRMINWWAPLAALAIAVHGSAITRRLCRRLNVPTLGGRSRALTLAILLPTAVALSTVPHALGVVEKRDVSRIVSSRTPIDSAEFVLNLPEHGLIFSPNTWGDYLTWLSNGRARVFATSHVHVIPRDVWIDYLTISWGRPGCVEVLDKRNVSTILLGHRRPALTAALLASPDWTRTHSTKRADIFVRHWPAR